MWEGRDFPSPSKTMTLLYFKNHTCETCHKHSNKNETPCQVVYNKTALYPIPDELKKIKE